MRNRKHKALLQSVADTTQPTRCTVCGFGLTCKSNRMAADGASPCDILVVGEAPGPTEDQYGKPFIGKSGDFLRDSLKTVLDNYDLSSLAVRFTNTNRCYPGKTADGQKRTPTKKEIRNCQQYLMTEIDECAPELVLVMGGNALYALTQPVGEKKSLGRDKITKFRGAPFKSIDGDRPCFATFHPAFVLRNMQTESTVLTTFLQDISTAVETTFKGVDTSIEYIDMGNGNMSEDRALAHLADREMFAFDLETLDKEPYNPNAKIFCIAFAYQLGDKVVGQVWPWRRFLPHAKRVLGSAQPKIAQNGKFDITYLKTTHGIEVKNWNYDTMLLHYLTDENARQHGLKVLVREYLPQYAGYEHIFQDAVRLGGMAKVPWSVMAPYCVRDAIFTYMLMEHFWGKGLTDTLKQCYTNWLHPLTLLLHRVEHNGMKVDVSVCKQLNVEISQVIETIKAKLKQGATVQKWMAAEPAESKVKARVRHDKYLWRTETLSEQPRDINFRSTQQLGSLLYEKEYFGYTPKRLTREKSMPSTDDAALARLSGTWIAGLRAMKRLEKQRSTYIEPVEKEWVRPDGLVHTQFGFANTVTGRLGSRRPNLQNITADEQATVKYGKTEYIFPVKRMFVSRFPNGLIAECDYNQIELRILAVLSGDENMCKAFREGKDIHRYTASQIYEKSEDKITTEQRREAKTVNFGVSYGSTYKDLYYQHGKSKAFWRNFYEQYFRLYPGIKVYQNTLLDFAHREGFIEAPSGMRRRLPLINSSVERERKHAENQAINFPIQHIASMLNLRGGQCVQTYIDKNRLKILLVNFVHDSSVYDVPPDEVEHLWTVKEILETPTVDWLTVPTPVNIKIGPNWYDTKPLEKPCPQN